MCVENIIYLSSIASVVLIYSAVSYHALGIENFFQILQLMSLSSQSLMMNITKVDKLWMELKLIIVNQKLNTQINMQSKMKSSEK